MSSVGLIHCN